MNNQIKAVADREFSHWLHVFRLLNGGHHPSAYEAWQPIETAPHRKYVLAAKESDSSGVCHVMWSSTERDTLADMGFTHWMPLPKPPETKEGQS